MVLPPQYLRFVISRRHPRSEVSEGVFQVAYELRDSEELTPHEFDEFRGALCWFGDHLERPSRFNRARSKGHYRPGTKGISWFKSTASKHLAQIRRIIVVLEVHGWFVSMIETRIPGFVVYEDDYQVVAEPFSDTRT